MYSFEVVNSISLFQIIPAIIFPLSFQLFGTLPLFLYALVWMDRDLSDVSFFHCHDVEPFTTVL